MKMSRPFREGEDGEVSARTKRFLAASGRLPRQSPAVPAGHPLWIPGIFTGVSHAGWGGATEHENIPPFEGGQRSRRGREGDVQPAGTGTPPGWLRHHPPQGGIFIGANENLLPAKSLYRV